MITLRILFFSLLLAVLRSSAAEPRRVPLDDVKRTLCSSNVVWDGDSVLFSNDQNRVRFYAGRRRADVNDVTVWLNALPAGNVSSGTWQIAAADLDLLGVTMLETNAPPRPLRVVLDAGHGGADDGASGDDPYVCEKELTLDLARRTAAALDTNVFDIVLTRTNDLTLALDERVAQAVRTNADLFVSLHGNFAANREAVGVETYVLASPGFPGTSEGSPARGWSSGQAFDAFSTAAGHAVHARLAACSTAQTNGVDRGLKRAYFYVLREAKCPAVLVEVGFLSNTAEAALLTNEIHRATLSQALANGIADYARRRPAVQERVAELRTRDAERARRWVERQAPLAAERRRKEAAAVAAHLAAAAVVTEAEAAGVVGPGATEAEAAGVTNAVADPLPASTNLLLAAAAVVTEAEAAGVTNEVSAVQ